MFNVTNPAIFQIEKFDIVQSKSGQRYVVADYRDNFAARGRVYRCIGTDNNNEALFFRNEIELTQKYVGSFTKHEISEDCARRWAAHAAS